MRIFCQAFFYSLSLIHIFSCESMGYSDIRSPILLTEMDSATIRQWLLDERGRRELTQIEFGALIGVAQSTISKSEDLSLAYEFGIDTLSGISSRLGFTTLSAFLDELEGLRKEPLNGSTKQDRTPPSAARWSGHGDLVPQTVIAAIISKVFYELSDQCLKAAERVLVDQSVPGAGTDESTRGGSRA